MILLNTPALDTVPCSMKTKIAQFLKTKSQGPGEMYFPIHPSSPQFADTLLLTLLLRLLCRCAAPYASRYHIDFKISFCRTFCECAGNHLKNVNANLSGDGPEEGGKGEGGIGQKREGGGEY